ncbi:MAG TPA: TonB-dependent receptor plug domain-containing protein, partial [Steroidobacteraceae bacterium]|nr:TonB-dependent receptor plug domain-containing protein [Steroidobacteraceae bacterium]
MPSARVESRSLSLAAAVSLTLLTSQINAQEAERTEEIVVTGSYIKRDTFDAPSPTEVIDSTAIAESGAPTMGNFIRDLTFTQNTDVVSNVLGTQDGQQDSNSANFNIRGLGTGSTLTLFDGRRIVDPGSVGGVVPELAMQRFEVVLDGGAALYGTDAVAGVVNIIPVKKFDGFKTRVYYNQDEKNTFHQPKYSMLAGTSFFDALDVVFAADYSKKTALYRAERPEYLRIDNDSSVSGNPGVYTRLTGGPTGAANTAFIDPSCGTFNTGFEDHGMQGSFPSGLRTATGCTFEYGQYQDYARPAEDTNLYLSGVYAITDSINLEFQANGDFRTSDLITSPSTALTANNTKLRVPVNNPGNTSGSLLRMGGTGGSGWRPFTGYGVLPSHLDHRGATNTEYNYTTDRYKLGLTYDIGASSWSGETWVSTQTYRREISGYAPLMDRMQLALNGQGGPNGNQFWNPFGNSDPRSPDYTAARANSQEVVDWMWVPDEYELERERVQFIESIVT